MICFQSALVKSVPSVSILMTVQFETPLTVKPLYIEVIHLLISDVPEVKLLKKPVKFSLSPAVPFHLEKSLIVSMAGTKVLQAFAQSPRRKHAHRTHLCPPGTKGCPPAPWHWPLHPQKSYPNPPRSRQAFNFFVQYNVITAVGLRCKFSHS